MLWCCEDMVFWYSYGVNIWYFDQMLLFYCNFEVTVKFWYCDVGVYLCCDALIEWYYAERHVIKMLQCCGISMLCGSNVLIFCSNGIVMFQYWSDELLWCCDDMILCDIVMVWWLDILIKWYCYVAMLYFDVSMLWHFDVVWLWCFNRMTLCCIVDVTLYCSGIFMWYDFNILIKWYL